MKKLGKISAFAVLASGIFASMLGTSAHATAQDAPLKSGSYLGVAVSQDGTKMAYSPYVDSTKLYDLYVKDLKTGVDTLVAGGVGSQGGARLSDDGNTIVWIDTDHKMKYDIYAKNLVTGVVTLVKGGAVPNRPYLTLSGDGNIVTWEEDMILSGSVAAGAWSSSSDILGFDLSTGKQFAIDGDGKNGVTKRFPTVSADGKWASYVYYTPTDYHDSPYIKNLQTGVETRLDKNQISGGTVISPNGKYVAYQFFNQTTRQYTLRVANVQTGEKSDVMFGDVYNWSWFVFAPDGEHILYPKHPAKSWGPDQLYIIDIQNKSEKLASDKVGNMYFQSLTNSGTLYYSVYDTKTGLKSFYTEDVSQFLGSPIKAIETQLTQLDTLTNAGLSTQADINALQKTLDDIQTRVNALPAGDQRIALQQKLDALVKKATDAQNLLNAQNAIADAQTVTSAELTAQPAIDAAQQAIDKAVQLTALVADQADKDGFNTQLQQMQATVTEAQNILNAKTAVGKAEASVNGDLSTQSLIDAAQASVTEAQELVDKVQTVAVRDELQSKVDAAQQSIYVAQAKLHVTTAEVAKTQASVDRARASVAKVADATLKAELTHRVDIVQTIIDATNLINQVNSTVPGSLTDVDVAINTLAKADALIATLVQSQDKADLFAKLTAAKDNLCKELISLLEQKQKGKKEKLSDLSLDFLVQYAIKEVGATTAQDKGKVKGFVMPIVAGHATGDRVNTVIDKYLN